MLHVYNIPLVTILLLAPHIYLITPRLRLEMSKVQDDEVGDGTTSVAILASELLKEAEALVTRKIHPQTIVEGFRKATDCAKQALIESSLNHGFA